MINWIKDLIGINRYKVCWDFNYKETHLSGEYDFIDRSHNGLHKIVAKGVVQDFNKMYGPNSHWIERL